MSITLLKLGIAAILGMIIGLERELKHKPLGIKTCIVIAVSSCLLTIISIEASIQYASMSENIRTDPMRLSAQIVSGIGFLGAGVILRRGNQTISGLTTAAIIWAAAGLGIAAGAGFYIESSMGALIILFSVNAVPFIISKLGPKKLRSKEMKISVLFSENSQIQKILHEFEVKKIEVKNLKIEDLSEGKFQMDVKVYALQNYHTSDVYFSIHDIPGVKGVKLETM